MRIPYAYSNIAKIMLFYQWCCIQIAVLPTIIPDLRTIITSRHVVIRFG
jgi:hypothetical protein